MAELGPNNPTEVAASEASASSRIHSLAVDVAPGVIAIAGCRLCV
jgi:hypothetical protein